MAFDGLTALFHPTPQEHLNDMWRRVKKLPPCPPPKHVRVHVYLGWQPGCDDTEFVMRHSALVGDFALDRAGRLVLAKVRDRWALRGCAVRALVIVLAVGGVLTWLGCSQSIRVDGSSSIRRIQNIYRRLRFGCLRRMRGCSSSLVCRRPQLSRPTHRAPLIAYRTEPTPSEGTIAMRELRLWLVTAYDNFLSSLHEATLGRLVDTIGLLATVRSTHLWTYTRQLFYSQAILLTMVTLGAPAVLGWYLLSTQRWWAYVVVAVSR